VALKQRCGGSDFPTEWLSISDEVVLFMRR
jgi:hypothetical protein